MSSRPKILFQLKNTLSFLLCTFISHGCVFLNFECWFMCNTHSAAFCAQDRTGQKPPFLSLTSWFRGGHSHIGLVHSTFVFIHLSIHSVTHLSDWHQTRFLHPLSWFFHGQRELFLLSRGIPSNLFSRHLSVKVKSAGICRFRPLAVTMHYWCLVAVGVLRLWWSIRFIAKCYLILGVSFICCIQLLDAVAW